MPAIMAAHIAHNSNSRGASHSTVIIHAEEPVIGPYMSRAMLITQSQQTSGRMIRTTTRLSRGRASADSMRVGDSDAISLGRQAAAGESREHLHRRIFITIA